MQAVAERLSRRLEVGISAGDRIGCEYRRAREPEQMVVAEPLGDGPVHVAELRAVALVEDEHHVLAVHVVPRVFAQHGVELLNRGHVDPLGRVGEVLLEDGARRGAIDGALLELLVLAHGLVVQVLAVHHEQHLVHALHGTRELRALEAREGLARARRVPDVTSRGERAQKASVRLADEDAREDGLGRRDLVRPHDHEVAVHREHAVPGEDVEQRPLGEERPSEVLQVADEPVRGVGPVARELERARLAPPRVGVRVGPLAHVRRSGRVAVVLGQRAVGDHEELHPFEKATPRPERLAAVAVDLVERLAQGPAATLELDVDEGQAVHEHGHVVAVVVRAAAGNVLVDDLNLVAVDVGLVDDIDVLGRTVRASEGIAVVALELLGLLGHAVGCVREVAGEERVPLVVGEGDAVQLFQAGADVGDELVLRGYG